MPKTNSLEELQSSLLKRRRNDKTWASMAREYGVNPAVLWRIVNEGYNPKKEETRAKLNLPELIQQSVYRDEHGRFRKAGE